MAKVTPINRLQTVPEDEDLPSFGPATPARNRADRRKEAKETAKVLAKAKGQGPLSIEELLGATVPVDILGDGRLVVYFYTNRFTSRLMKPVEEAEAELTKLGVMQTYIKQATEKAAKEKRGLTEEEKETVAEFMQNPATITASDYTAACIAALIGPQNEDGTSNRELGLLESWTLTASGSTAPLTWDFLEGVLGADLVSMILRKIRDRWKPGETKGVASA